MYILVLVVRITLKEWSDKIESQNRVLQPDSSSGEQTKDSKLNEDWTATSTIINGRRFTFENAKIVQT